ncbi:uncharacterized protein PG998_009905 [Apiospora kogelbergensis]|uniref:Uncharacterized protein n=1 Tax=Apiospora kogelbergensis TaxID=1337665 RepID=A0AAW0R968_9PEZI
MQSLALLLSLAPLAAMALPQSQDPNDEFLTPDPTASMYALPSSMPAGNILSGYYNGAIPPQVTGAVATSLASAVYSYEKELMTDSKYRSVANEVYMAAVSASADDLFVGDKFDMPFTTASWYTAGVPADDRKAIESYVNAYKAIETSVLGGSAKATATTSGAAAPSSTGGSAGPSQTAGPSGSANGNGPSQTGKDDKAASSTSANAAPAATGRVIAGLAAGVAMGLAAAL